MLTLKNGVRIEQTLNNDGVYMYRKGGGKTIVITQEELEAMLK